MRSSLVTGALVALAVAACSGSSPDPNGFGNGDAGVHDGSSPPPATPASDGGFAPGLGDASTTDASRGCTDVVDLVFVLDVSSSMDFVLDKLGTDIDKVVAAANKLAPDSHFGLIAFVDNYALDTTGPLEGGKVHVDGSTLRKAFEYDKATYTTPNRNPGDGPKGRTTQNPICEENALDALYAATSEFPWRPNATRVVIVATDDTYLERPDNYGDRDGDGKTDKKDFPSEGDYPAKRTTSETIAAFKSTGARVFAFTRLKEPGFLDFGKCSTGRRLPWSSVSDGWTTPYKGQTPIPTATAGKNFDLDGVKDGKISLADTINEVVLDSYCNPPPK